MPREDRPRAILRPQPLAPNSSRPGRYCASADDGHTAPLSPMARRPFASAPEHASWSVPALPVWPQIAYRPRFELPPPKAGGDVQGGSLPLAYPGDSSIL
jgi:hypothetical protein